MSDAIDSDDDKPQLSSFAAAALAEFLAERKAAEEAFEKGTALASSALCA